MGRAAPPKMSENFGGGVGGSKRGCRRGSSGGDFGFSWVFLGASLWFGYGLVMLRTICIFAAGNFALT